MQLISSDGSTNFRIVFIVIQDYNGIGSCTTG